VIRLSTEVAPYVTHGTYIKRCPSRGSTIAEQLLSLRSPGHVCVRNNTLVSAVLIILRVNILLLYSIFYYHPFSSGRDPLVILTSGPFLSLGRDFIFQANTFLLYSVFYYYFFFSGRDLLIVLTSGPFLPLGYNFIFQANTLLLYSVLYYYPFFRAVIL
jgi:small-conductance mechanosensitive channel